MANDYELQQALLKVLHEHGVHVEGIDFTAPRPKMLEPRTARPRIRIEIRGRS
jgi:hypothetical protein